jgi:hypothetical protein
MRRIAFAVAIGVLAAAHVNAQGLREDLQFIVSGDTAVSIFQDYERPAPGVKVDDVDFSWQFQGAVRYKWVGVSAGYVDFGELHARGPLLRDRIELRGATVSALGFVPLMSEQLTLVGELGALFWQQDVDFRDNIGS